MTGSERIREIQEKARRKCSQPEYRVALKDHTTGERINVDILAINENEAMILAEDAFIGMIAESVEEITE